MADGSDGQPRWPAGPAWLSLDSHLSGCATAMATACGRRAHAVAAGVLRSLGTHPRGLGQDALEKQSKVSKLDLVPVLNVLAQRRRIEISQPKGSSEPLFMLPSVQPKSQFRGVSWYKPVVRIRTPSQEAKNPETNQQINCAHSFVAGAVESAGDARWHEVPLGLFYGRRSCCAGLRRGLHCSARPQAQQCTAQFSRRRIRTSRTRKARARWQIHWRCSRGGATSSSSSSSSSSSAAAAAAAVDFMYTDSQEATAGLRGGR